MKLPNADNAVVQIEKLREYSLNFLHPTGKHKAKVFRSAFGFEIGDAEFLRTVILEKTRTEDALFIMANSFGDHYFLDFHLEYLGKSANIRTKWIVETGENYPRLTSCYVKRKE
jgi:hypothetical protein